MRARYYNTDIKRFMNRDVVVGSIESSQTLNRYAFVNGNPITFHDPFGLAREMLNPKVNYSELIHTALDIGGLVPVLGSALDVANGLYYLAEGNYSYALLSGVGAVPVIGEFAIGAKYGLKTYNTVSKTDNLLKLDLQYFGSTQIKWGTWDDYSKVNVDGRDYARVGDRLFTKHAVDRMQPSSMRYQSGKLDGGLVSASRLYRVPQKDYGRSISPNYVEDVINQNNFKTVEVNGVERQLWESGTVKVVTEDSGFKVITILTK